MAEKQVVGLNENAPHDALNDLASREYLSEQYQGETSNYKDNKLGVITKHLGSLTY